MPYVFTQFLSQLPVFLLASFVGMALFEPNVRSNGLAVFALCFVAAPVISGVSLYAHRRINASFGIVDSVKSSLLPAVLFGVVLAILTLAALLLSLYALGAISFSWSRVSLVQVAIGAGLAFISAPVEEVIFRGVVQRKLTGRIGAPAAIAVASLLFSLAHLSNPGSGIQSLILVAAFTSVLLGVTYWITGSFLASVAAHFAWNFLMFGLVGGNVSGFVSEGMVVMNKSAGDLLTGGTFGIESSVLCPVAVLVAFALLWKPAELFLSSSSVGDVMSQRSGVTTGSST